MYDSALFYYRQQLKVINAPELHYNCGNAAFKAGLLGQALWHYNCALKLKPGYTNAYYNLEILHQKKPQPEFQFWKFIKQKLQYNISYTFWFIINIIVLILGFMFFTYCFIYTLKFHVIFNLVFISVFGITLGLGLWQFQHQTTQNQGIIIASQVKYYAEPNTASESRGVLPEGSYFKPIQTSEHWTLIETEFQQEGWVANSHLRFF